MFILARCICPLKHKKMHFKKQKKTNVIWGPLPSWAHMPGILCTPGNSAPKNNNPDEAHDVLRFYTFFLLSSCFSLFECLFCLLNLECNLRFELKKQYFDIKDSCPVVLPRRSDLP